MTKEAPAPDEIVLLIKFGCGRTDAHTIDANALPEIRLELRLPLSLTVTVMIPVNMQVKILIH